MFLIKLAKVYKKQKNADPMFSLNLKCLDQEV